MSKLFVDEIVHQSSQGSGTITIGASGETINVVGTLQNNGSAVGGVNTPAFEAYMSSGQTGVADNVWVKLNFNTEKFDTNSYYDTSTYRFTPLVAGKYYIYAQGYCYPTSADSIYSADISIYKNGSNYKYASFRANSSYPIGEVTKFIGATIEFNGSTDYVEVYGRINVTTSTGNFEGTSPTNVFGGYKIIE